MSTDRSLDIAAQGCADCRFAWFVYYPSCPACGSEAVTGRRRRPDGIVYSLTETHYAAEGSETSVPFTTVVVDVDGGGRVVGTYDDPEPAEIGGRVFVQAVHEDGRLLYRGAHSS